MHGRFALLSIAAALAACSSSTPSDEPTPEPSYTEPAPLPEPMPEPTFAREPVALPTGPNGCPQVQLGGTWMGEGLGKRYVPGPVVEVCNPAPPIVAPRAAEEASQQP